MPPDCTLSPEKNISAVSTANITLSLPPRRPLWLWLLLVPIAGITLYLLSRANYLLFHALAEFSSIVLAAAVFTIGWNARQLVHSPVFLILATGFIAAGFIDLLHILAYKGMGVFKVIGSDLSIQLWMVARGLGTAAFFMAALHLGRPQRVSPWLWLWSFGGAAALLLALIWPLQIFPRCFIDGVGLTPFKIAGEYLFAAMLTVAAVLLWRRREHLGPRLGGLLLAAVVFNIASELSFTLYHDPYDLANFIGHLFKLGTVIMVYHALVEGTLRVPYGTLFRELTALNRNLDAELQRRESTETLLRAANHEFSILYRSSRMLHSTLRLDALTHLILSMATSPEGGDLRRAMLFTINERTGVLQGMLGVERQSARLVLPLDATTGLWGEPQLDAETCTAQRGGAANLAVVKQRLALVADDNALAQAFLEHRLVLVEKPAAEPPGGRRLAEDLSLSVYACAPLGRREVSFGVLLVDLEGIPEAIVPERLRFIELLAEQATAALENARLLHRLEGAHRELREVQEQMLQGEKLAVLGEMAAQVAHELRNPLVLVGGFAQRLAKLELGNESATEYTAIIVREVRRLEEMLGNILAFSKKQLICLEPCDLNTLLGDVLELEAEARHSAGITLELDILAPLPEIIGDCRQLRQVVLNLLSNARQAMSRGGIITLRADRCTLRGEDAVSIEVEDTGGGIPSEIMRNIFNPFFSTHPKGTGLGLSISHRIVDQHRGEIEAVNGLYGACFIVRLPLHPTIHAIR